MTLISIVTGTYNRLSYLQAMITSARRQFDRGIAYEFVVVDGGSTDGTIQWCQQQADVTLIEHGGLLGAIKAFCDGATAAQGEYVLLANDDIEFEGYGILRAIAHLQDNPLCGAVAFQDDRPAPDKPQAMGAQTMAVRVYEHIDRLPYAQVGLYPKWLGDFIGWWGADDPQFRGHTYGGDNYLSAKLYELGYRVDVLADVRCFDRIPPDNLRTRNLAIEQTPQTGGAYYRLYPEAPVYAQTPQVSIPTGDPLRIFYMPIFEQGYSYQRANKRGLFEALQAIGAVYEFDYQNELRDVCAIVQAWQPDIVFTQVHGHNFDYAALRASAPNALFLNWNGDVHEHGLTTPEMLAMLQHVDVQLTVNGSVLDIYAEHGIKAAYWQNGYEPVAYDHLPPMPAFDIVFAGSNYSTMRQDMGMWLHLLPYTIGLYGTNWRELGQGDSTYQFPEMASVYQNSAICLGDNQWKGEGFISDRIFNTLAAGGFLLHQEVTKLYTYTGYKSGVHYVSWSDYDDLREKIDHYMAHPEERAKIAAAGQAYTHTHHSHHARVRQLFNELLPELL